MTAFAQTGAGLAPGTLIGGDFAVLGPLNRGGMGAVYRVEQRSTGKQRALKVMHREIVTDPAMQKRFEREAKIGARIQSDHVVEVVAAGVDANVGLPFLVMELLDGEDLRAHLDHRGAVGLDDLRSIFEQLCHAMAAAHAAGVVHRDLKPENIFLARGRRAGSARSMVKVLDFGIAKLVQETGTRATRGTMGSPIWMAPEQTVPGAITPAADVWALGLIAYELCTGRNFWRAANEEGGTTAQLLREIVLDPIPTASERAREQRCEGRIPPGFDAWFSRCVVRDAKMRFPEADALWNAMTALFRARDALAATSLAIDSEDGGIVPPVRFTPNAELSATGDPTEFVEPVRARGAPATPSSGAAVASQGGSLVDGLAATGLPNSEDEARIPARPLVGPSPETPIASVRSPSVAPPRDTSSGPPGTTPGDGARAPRSMLLAAAIAVAGIAVGWGLSRRDPIVVNVPASGGIVTAATPSPSHVPPPPSSASLATSPTAAPSETPGGPPDATPIASSTATAPPSGTSSAAAKPPLLPTAVPGPDTSRGNGGTTTSTSTALTTANAAPAPTTTPTRKGGSIPGGFSDPTDRHGAVQWKVGEHSVRLFTRLVSNDTNVADATVRNAMDWSSWEYLMCYERMFAGAKDLPEGTVNVAFDVIDQLPRHGALQSSTIESAKFNECVVRTLIGHTFNAAGPDGRGHAVFGLRFVPN